MNNRLQNGQRLRNSFACVVDGETEIWYLNMLKRNEPSMKNISIRPELPQKKTLEEQFKQVQTLAESYTAVFWIIDTDTIISNERTFAGDRNKSPRVVLKKCVFALPESPTDLSCNGLPPDRLGFRSSILICPSETNTRQNSNRRSRPETCLDGQSGIGSTVPVWILGLCPTTTTYIIK